MKLSHGEFLSFDDLCGLSFQLTQIFILKIFRCNLRRSVALFSVRPLGDAV